MTFRSLSVRISAIAGVLLASGCGSGMLDVGFPTAVTNAGGGTTGASAIYVGEMADSLRHGTLSLTVSSALSVTGLLTFAGGPTVQVAGSVDTVVNAIHATGGGYSISGFTNLGTISGSYSGAGVSGFLVATSDSLTGLTHNTYCGSYTSTYSSGFIAVQVLSRGDVGGFAVQTSGTSVSSFLTGTVIGGFSFAAVTTAGVPLSGSLSADLSTITGTYAPPVANSTTTNTATGQFSMTTGGC